MRTSSYNEPQQILLLSYNVPFLTSSTKEAYLPNLLIRLQPGPVFDAWSETARPTSSSSW